MRGPGIVCALALLVAAGGSHAVEPAGAGAGRPPEPAVSAALEGGEVARAVVESFHAALLASMREGEALGFQGRYERIAASLDETFDLPFMARTMLGATWRELDEAQRTDFLELSRRLSASRYADNFASYDGQSFETRSERAAARGTIMVTTELVQPNDRNVQFDYRLRKLDGRWRIIDVLYDGQISDMVLWRGQYRSVIEREGFSQLVVKLEERIEELSRD